MTSIVDFALNKAKTTLTIAFLVVIAGTFARQEIPISASPNVQLPFYQYLFILMEHLLRIHHD